MPVLEIGYDDTSRRAIISIDNAHPSWNELRRAFLETSASVEDLGPLSLAVPWWSFLSARTALNFHVRRGQLEVRIAENARTLLQRAAGRHKQYRTLPEAAEHDPRSMAASLQRRGFRRELTPEQLRNVLELLKLDAGASFSVPGAGKTTEGLAFFFLRREPSDRLLVVCPKNAFSVWEEQVKKCVPEFGGRIVRLTGGEAAIRDELRNPPEIALITYQQLPTALDAVATFLAEYRCFVILDESHRIKRGQEGVWARSVLSLAHLPVAKLIMSGTPLPNSTADLIPQFGFLYPEIKADENSVTELIRPIYVRTKKSELDIPPLERRLKEIPLTPDLQYFYELLRSESARQAENALPRFARARLRAIGNSALRLIRFVANPSLLLSDDGIRDEIKALFLQIDENPKIEYVCHRARALAASGNKVVVWSTFVSNVELVATRLVDLGAEFIHGGVEAGTEEEEDTRERKLRRFKSDAHCSVLVANPAACGEGISLHDVCHHAIYLDRNFNAAQFLQSEDRIHRLGLPKGQMTNVEIVCCPDTIDVVVDHRLREKVRRMGAVLDDKELHIDPVVFDPDDEGLDEDDAAAVAEHIAGQPIVP